MTPRRVVLALGLLVLLWQAVTIATPFNVGRSSCGAAVVEATRNGTPKADLTLEQMAKASSRDIFGSPCPTTARRRLWRAGAIAVAAWVGAIIAFWLFRPTP